jgi:4-hydroxybenzoate polyprenyltransferase
MVALSWRQKALVLVGVCVLAYVCAAWLAGLSASVQLVGLGLLVAYVAVALPYMRRREQTDAPGDLHLRQ